MATIVAEEAGVNLKRQLEKLFDASLKLTVPDELGVVEALVTRNQKYGDYQCNNAMSIGPLMKKKGCCQFCGDTVRIGQALVINLPISEMVDSCCVTRPGFVKVVLSAEWMAESILNMVMNGVDSWAPNLGGKRAFCSPNIAKEKHVGHLRSTIIGATLTRMLEFSKVQVVRRTPNVDCWRKELRMRLEFFFEVFPRSSMVMRPIGDLRFLYRKTKLKFDGYIRGEEWILEKTAEAVGYDEFADLDNNSYILSLDEFFGEKGHTAICLHYAHARICSIIKKSGKDIDDRKASIGSCRGAGTGTVEEACTTLLPHLLCDYLCKLSKLFTKFYSNCQVNGSPEETSRLLLCQATALVMRKCFYLLGITPLYKL